jgi:hypothetical protein
MFCHGGVWHNNHKRKQVALPTPSPTIVGHQEPKRLIKKTRTIISCTKTRTICPSQVQKKIKKKTNPSLRSLAVTCFDHKDRVVHAG